MALAAAMHEHQILRSVEDILADGVIKLWGAGETGQEFARMLARLRPDVRVESFVDSYRSGVWQGIPIEQPTPTITWPSGGLIISSVFWNEIAEKVRTDYRIDYKVLSNQLIHSASHLAQLGSFTFSSADLAPLSARLESLKEHLASEDDKALLQAVYDLRAHGKEARFFQIVEDRVRRQGRGFAQADKYATHIDLRDIKYVVEGGVFDGQDTLSLMKAMEPYGELQRVYAFDPFLETLRGGAFVDQIDVDKCEFHPNVLWDHEGVVSFGVDAEHPANSAVQADGGTSDAKSFPAVTIDGFLQRAGTGVDLIKLDVEGSEMRVLKGARRSIAEYRPKLAISMYHRKEDLFEIPEFLLAIHPDYELTLSANGPTFVDMVIYAR